VEVLITAVLLCIGRYFAEEEPEPSEDDSVFGFEFEDAP